MQVLYVDGKGVRQVSVCEHCKRQVTDEECEETYFLHKVKPVAGEQYAEISFVHAECAASFINAHNSLQDKWFFCSFDDWTRNATIWREVDLVQAIEQLEEVAL